MISTSISVSPACSQASAGDVSVFTSSLPERHNEEPAREVLLSAAVIPSVSGSSLSAVPEPNKTVLALAPQGVEVPPRRLVLSGGK